MRKIKLVVATREDGSGFLTSTAIGRSLAKNMPGNVELRVAFRNQRGLPAVYNAVIRETERDPAILVFAHDDLHLLDFFWAMRIAQGLQVFDVLGVAGSRTRLPRQAIWGGHAAPEAQAANWSGLIAHGKGFPPDSLHFYGPPRQPVKLLDGLLLAVDSETLWRHQLFFDERFMFHFYDLDFCRQAEVKGVRCGTWDLSLIHESRGAYGTPAWTEAYRKYLEKWGD